MSNQFILMNDVMCKFSQKKFWKDKCGHKKEEYVGSVESLDGEKLDIYVFKTKINDKNQDVLCIRHGNIDNQYYSPSDLTKFIAMASGITKYQLALNTLLHFGEIVFSRKK